MTVIEDPTFNSEAPEKYNWGLLDSPTLEKLAVEFSSRIHRESLFKDRPYMGGLRYALIEIAKVAKL